MAYEFLYTTNEMNNEELINYLFNLFNTNNNQKINRSNIVDLVENILPATSESNGNGLIDELWGQIEPASKVRYISQEKTLDTAIKDFFNTSKHDFALDLWDVDNEIEIVNNDGSQTKERKQIDITHYEQWDF